MKILYDNSKAVKINDEMRSNLNIYNQRKTEINDHTRKILEYQRDVNNKTKELEDLQIAANGDDKRAAKEANKKIKGLQKEIDKLHTLEKESENKKTSLLEKQNRAYIDGVQYNTFPENEEISEENSETQIETKPEAIGEYKEEESFIPESAVEITEVSDGPTLEEEDLDAIWNKLHHIDEKDNEEAIMKEEAVTPIYEEPVKIDPVYEDTTNVEKEPAVNTEQQVETPEENTELEEEKVNIIEPTVISEEPNDIIEESKTDVTAEETNITEPTIISEEKQDVDDDSEIDLAEEIITNDNESDQDKIHRELQEEFPKIEVPEPMDSESKLKSIYEEVDVEPKLLDKSTTRDLKNLTLFVDYNDYTFTFGQQHYNKEALTPEEIETLDAIKSYLKEKEFNDKRTIQYNKITSENKRLNRKIVTLSKEFTRTVDKLSKEYVSTTDELTKQTNRAKEQIEIDRVEKVQTQKLNDSLTDNIKEQNAHIDNLNEENSNLKETIEARDKTIKQLKDEIKDKTHKIKVFEEKLNTVLGIVKEVKNEKKDK